MLDLEDGVPAALKEEARANVEAVLARRRAWVRVNPGSEADVEAARGAAGLRLPKVRSADEARWLLDLVDVPVICSIENRDGLAAALEIAALQGVLTLSLGSKDMTADLGVADAWEALLPVREALVRACRGPVDSVYWGDDEAGLRTACEAASALGFSGKSTLRPEHVATINAVF